MLVNLVPEFLAVLAERGVAPTLRAAAEGDRALGIQTA
jgi:hypothetical protein